MLYDRIKQLRINRGITQVELAKELSVTKQAVSNWENDNIQPSVEMLIKIAVYFNVSVDYILGLDNRCFLEVTGLDDKKLSHIQLIINDMLSHPF